MSITVLEPALSFDLTVKEVVQAQLELSVGTDDSIINRLISAASSFIVEYTQRQFAREKWQELLPAYDTNWLQLNLTPIETISSVAVNGAVITDFIIEDAKAGLLFREKGWLSSLSFHRGITRHQLANSSLPRYKVEYFGGYVLSSHSGTANLPAVIEQAAVDLVAGWYRKIKDGLSDNVKQVKIGDYTISFDSDTGKEALGVSASILMKLRPWRRIV